MRILVVSAHYPPNFVSGGSLAPQRLARELQKRGHSVYVYAGWYGDGRRPLETFDEKGDDGIPVRWIVTTPFTVWDVRENFDNPSVARDFAGHVAALRPEIVHFHSLQGLGANLVDVAAAAGARVVVTAHDFWWHCGRQFLVDKQFSPCSLVVDCGNCPCEIDHRWLERRNAWLAQRLARADVVLAVSKSAAEVLAANGVDQHKLRVDENGLDLPIGLGPRTAEHHGPVRFAYMGGSDPMKGVHVLVDAARALAEVGGWSLTLYGAERYLAGAGVDLRGLPVESRPPFSPSEADAVFSQTDVLVVPSVMRESYSLVTREALQRGIPVVVTDTLGPEEVVTNGDNGMVVPAADVASLATAMRDLAASPELRQNLMTGAGRGAAIRTFEDQLDGLEALYGDVRQRAFRDVARTRRVRRVLFIVGIQGAPLRYRARLPAEGLALLGVRSDVRYYRDPDLPALAAKADAVVVYRVPATVQVLRLLDDIRAAGTPLFFDVDDLIFDPDLRDEIPALKILEGEDAELWLEGVRRYRTTMEACDAFIGSTAALVEHAQSVVGLPSLRFSNGVGLLLARASDIALTRSRAPGPLRIGYLSGTTTHDHDWAYVEPAVADVLDARPEVELWLGGYVNPSDALTKFGARVRRLPFRPWTEVPGTLRDLDVNLAPLEPGSVFNESKSAIKWLEAALTATPTVASPTEPFREAIEHGVNGLLAQSQDEWRDAICALVDDLALGRRIGERAKRDALLRWSPHLQGRRYLDILESPLEARRPSTWTAPVALDEPAEFVRLEPYGSRWPDLALEASHLLTRGRRSLGRVRARLRRVATRSS